MIRYIEKPRILCWTRSDPLPSLACAFRSERYCTGFLAREGIASYMTLLGAKARAVDTRSRERAIGKSCLVASAGFVAGVALTVTLGLSGATLGSGPGIPDHKLLARATKAETELAMLRASMVNMRQILARERANVTVNEPLSEATERKIAPAAVLGSGAGYGGIADAATWDDTADNRRIQELLRKVANAKREVMLTLANDVMMCTNRKTCWWNGGNVLETFLQASKRLALKNVVVITLDDGTHSFCEKVRF